MKIRVVKCEEVNGKRLEDIYWNAKLILGFHGSTDVAVVDVDRHGARTDYHNDDIYEIILE